MSRESTTEVVCVCNSSMYFGGWKTKKSYRGVFTLEGGREGGRDGGKKKEQDSILAGGYSVIRRCGRTAESWGKRQ